MVTEHPTVRVRRRRDVYALVGGLVVILVAALIAGDGNVPEWEETLFEAVNDLPEFLYPVAWPFQQLGALVVGPLVAIVALVLRRYWLALAAVLATIGKLVMERIVKALVSRERPGTSIGPGIEARGDVSLSGESFVSGHAMLVTALAGVIAPYLPARWAPVPWVLVGLVMFGRVYVGAHNPLDVIGGAAVGLAIAAVINLALGVPARRSENQRTAAPIP